MSTTKPLIRCIFTLLALVAMAKAAEPQQPPNIVIIYIDDMGYASQRGSQRGHVLTSSR